MGRSYMQETEQQITKNVTDWGTDNIKMTRARPITILPDEITKFGGQDWKPYKAKKKCINDHICKVVKYFFQFI